VALTYNKRIPRVKHKIKNYSPYTARPMHCARAMEPALAQSAPGRGPKEFTRMKGGLLVS